MRNTIILNHTMDEEISVINLSENQMIMEGYHYEKISSSDSKAPETSHRTVNTPSDDSKFEKAKYSIHDSQNKDSNTIDLVNTSTEDETKLEDAADNEIYVGCNSLKYFNALIIIGVIMICVCLV